MSESYAAASAARFPVASVRQPVAETPVGINARQRMVVLDEIPGGCATLIQDRRIGYPVKQKPYHLGTDVLRHCNVQMCPPKLCSCLQFGAGLDQESGNPGIDISSDRLLQRRHSEMCWRLQVHTLL